MRKVLGLVGGGIAAAAVALAVGASATQGGGAMFRGDGARTGLYHTPGVERFGGIQWRFQTGGMVQSSAAVMDGVAYVGSGDGDLYALDATNGRERWRFAAGRAITSSPAVIRGAVYFGSRDNRFYAVDAGSGRQRWQVTTGADAPLAWGFESGDLYTSSPVWSEGLVVFGSGDGRVYAVDDGSGEVRWRFKTEGRVRSSPAIANGRVVRRQHGRHPVRTEPARRSHWSVDPARVSEPLALDDNGLAGAWVKNYGGPPGTGFVRIYGGGWMGGGPSANFASVQAVAEYRPR